MAILTQFLLRTCFGLALGMALTNPKQVTSGYYRNHLYVLMGMLVLASLVAASARDQFSLALPIAGAVLSYMGAVAWLYEKPPAGIAFLMLVAALTLLGAWYSTPLPSGSPTIATALALADPATSGLVLGLTLAAMFLGHWYLNTPTMAIGPLEKLVLLLAGAILLRALIEAALLAQGLSAGMPAAQQLIFLSLRWLSGIVGALVLVWMTWKTLKIPNTQSATGILYVCVIATFLGELSSMLLAQTT